MSFPLFFHSFNFKIGLFDEKIKQSLLFYSSVQFKLANLIFDDAFHVCLLNIIWKKGEYSFNAIWKFNVHKEVNA
jgi:hypothetical protein